MLFDLDMYVCPHDLKGDESDPNFFHIQTQGLKTQYETTYK